jgi:hypothetical protein
VSISFFLIADNESPFGGIIRVQPENLVSLSQSFHPAIAGSLDDPVATFIAECHAEKPENYA